MGERGTKKFILILAWMHPRKEQTIEYATTEGDDMFEGGGGGCGLLGGGGGGGDVGGEKKRIFGLPWT